MPEENRNNYKRMYKIKYIHYELQYNYYKHITNLHFINSCIVMVYYKFVEISQ